MCGQWPDLWNRKISQESCPHKRFTWLHVCPSSLWACLRFPHVLPGHWRIPVRFNLQHLLLVTLFLSLSLCRSCVFLNFRCFQTCRSTLSPPSRRARTCCRETECLTTSKASTSSITSGGSDMTGPFTREPKTRRMSLRYVCVYNAFRGIQILLRYFSGVAAKCNMLGNNYRKSSFPWTFQSVKMTHLWSLAFGRCQTASFSSAPRY